VFVEVLRLSEGQAGGDWETFKQSSAPSEGKKKVIL